MITYLLIVAQLRGQYTVRKSNKARIYLRIIKEQTPAQNAQKGKANFEGQTWCELECP